MLGLGEVCYCLSFPLKTGDGEAFWTVAAEAFRFIDGRYFYWPEQAWNFFRKLSEIFVGSKL